MSTTTNEQVVQRMRAELKRRRISGSELARRMDVSQRFVSRRLCCKVPWNLDELEDVAEVLDTHVEAFLPIPAEVSS